MHPAAIVRPILWRLRTSSSLARSLRSAALILGIAAAGYRMLGSLHTLTVANWAAEAGWDDGVLAMLSVAVALALPAMGMVGAVLAEWFPRCGAIVLLLVGLGLWYTTPVLAFPAAAMFVLASVLALLSALLRPSRRSPL